MIDWNIAVPATALILSGYAALQQRWISRDNARRDSEIALLKKQADLFWAMVEQHMTTVLHSPHTPDMDSLLEKWQAGEILTDAEAVDLKDKLLETINSSTESQGNRAGAVFLLAALERKAQIKREDDGTWSVV